MRFKPDPKLGYPHWYRRDVMGTSLSIAIDVVKLVPASNRARRIDSPNAGRGSSKPELTTESTRLPLAVERGQGQTHWPRTSFKTRIATGAGMRRSTASSLSIPTIPTSKLRSGRPWQTFPTRRPKTVADLGCGTGPLLPYLAERFGKVIALDFAPAMLKLAADRLESRSRGPGDIPRAADA